MKSTPRGESEPGPGGHTGRPYGGTGGENVRTAPAKLKARPGRGVLYV